MNAFSDEKRKETEQSMLEDGFQMIRKGGLKAVNIGGIASDCHISKGCFYSFYKSKAEFIYAIMIYKRNQARERLTTVIQVFNDMNIVKPESVPAA